MRWNVTIFGLQVQSSQERRIERVAALLTVNKVLQDEEIVRISETIVAF
jgi:hypothetical protein